MSKICVNRKKATVYNLELIPCPPAQDRVTGRQVGNACIRLCNVGPERYCHTMIERDTKHVSTPCSNTTETYSRDLSLNLQESCATNREWELHMMYDVQKLRPDPPCVFLTFGNRNMLFLLTFIEIKVDYFAVLCYGICIFLMQILGGN